MKSFMAPLWSYDPQNTAFFCIQFFIMLTSAIYIYEPCWGLKRKLIFISRFVLFSPVQLWLFVSINTLHMYMSATPHPPPTSPTLKTHLSWNLLFHQWWILNTNIGPKCEVIVQLLWPSYFFFNSLISFINLEYTAVYIIFHRSCNMWRWFLSFFFPFLLSMLL